MERKIDLLVPDLGNTESIELIVWNFKVGDAFEEGDELCEMVTDKAAFSLEADQPGRIAEILTHKGFVKKGQVIGSAFI